MSSGSNRYQFLALLGEGGSARVYRAVEIRADGIERQIAIKLLSEEPPDPEMLQRLNAEAVLLGLVCDRAIVSVEPPVRMGDRFAVVMEHINGVTLRSLLQQQPLPPGVAVEVIGEIARALHALSMTSGPFGVPLEIVHRDIKPDNVQITPSGEVKLLDFGNAKANLDGLRDDRTQTWHLAGTPGYIAPERAEGGDGAPGDVFALGVMLHEAVTGHRPEHPPEIAERTPEPGDSVDSGADLQEVLALAAQMRASDPSARPTAREVERLARALRLRLTGEYLQDWAALSVPHQPALPPDERIGGIYPPQDPHPHGRRLSIWTQVSFAAIASVLFITAISWHSEPSATLSVAESERELPLLEMPLATDIPSSPAAPQEHPPARPVPPKETPTPRPSEVQLTSGVQPTTAARTPAPSYEVLIVSIPFGARVEDANTGELFGTTPLRRSLPSGTHAIRLTTESGQKSETHIVVGRSMPIRYVWRVAEDQWESGY